MRPLAPDFRTQVEPHIDGTRVRYIGEVAGRPKQDLLARASALLMPIDWEEPFGMVMVEALACGTPVIAYPRGAVDDIVTHGRTGFLVRDHEAMAAAVNRLEEIDPATCRADVQARFDAATVARQYVRVYREAINPGAKVAGDPVDGERSSTMTTVPQ